MRLRTTGRAIAAIRTTGIIGKVCLDSQEFCANSDSWRCKQLKSPHASMSLPSTAVASKQLDYARRAKVPASYRWNLGGETRARECVGRWHDLKPPISRRASP